MLRGEAGRGSQAKVLALVQAQIAREMRGEAELRLQCKKLSSASPWTLSRGTRHYHYHFTLESIRHHHDLCCVNGTG